MMHHRNIRTLGAILLVLVASTWAPGQSSELPSAPAIRVLGTRAADGLMMPSPCHQSSIQLHEEIGAWIDESPPSQLALFPHFLIGGGFSTTIILSNTGPTAAIGRMTLTHESGFPLWSSLIPDSAGPKPSCLDEANLKPRYWFRVFLEPGETRVFTLTAPDLSYSTHRGWAKVIYRGGVIGRVALLKLQNGNTLRTMASVPSSQAVDSATIPVDNDLDEGRHTGIIIGNHTAESIHLKMIAVNADGSLAEVLSPIELNPLGPGRQVAGFVSEFSAELANFKGSIILVSPMGKSFIATAILEDQGIFTSLPVFPGTSSRIPIP